MDTDFDEKHPGGFRPATPMPSLTASQETSKPSEGQRAEMFKRAMQAAEQEPPGGIRPLKALGVPVTVAVTKEEPVQQQAQQQAQQIAMQAYRAGQMEGMKTGAVAAACFFGTFLIGYMGYAWMFPAASSVKKAHTIAVPKNPID